MSTIKEVLDAAFPAATDDDKEHILWARTPFPAGAISARSLYRAGASFLRAKSNGIELCDNCHRIATVRYSCQACHDSWEELMGRMERQEA